MVRSEADAEGHPRAEARFGDPHDRIQTPGRHRIAAVDGLVEGLATTGAFALSGYMVIEIRLTG